MSTTSRRQFLKLSPIAAIAPLVVAPSLSSLPKITEPGHYVIVINPRKVDMLILEQMHSLLPEGSTGGWIIPDYAAEQGIAFYKLA